MLNTKKISIHTTVAQGQGNIVSNMDGETVMMSVQNGKYYNLGEMGGVIWEKISIPTQVSVVVDSLMEDYDVDLDECKEQVLTFLEQLNKEEIIIIID
jgi:hypothetical protein